LILPVSQKSIGSDPSSSQLNKNSRVQGQNKHEPVDHVIKRKSHSLTQLTQLNKKDCDLRHSSHRFNQYETEFNSKRKGKTNINLRRIGNIT